MNPLYIAYAKKVEAGLIALNGNFKYDRLLTTQAFAVNLPVVDAVSEIAKVQGKKQEVERKARLISVAAFVTVACDFFHPTYPPF
jgi:hypothetical protein